MVEEGAKVGRIIICIKPETSEMSQNCFHAIVKAQNFPHSRVSHVNFGKGCAPSHYWAVLKNRYFS